MQVRSLGWKAPWRRAWQPAPALLPGDCHGQRSLAAAGHKARVGHDWVTFTRRPLTAKHKPLWVSASSAPETKWGIIPTLSISRERRDEEVDKKVLWKLQKGCRSGSLNLNTADSGGHSARPGGSLPTPTPVITTKNVSRHLPGGQDCPWLRIPRLW